MTTYPYFAMTAPPPDAEAHLLAYITAQQRNMGRLSPITGLPVSLISEYDDLAPSVKRVVDYLYENTECALNLTGCRKIGGANLKQLWIDIEWLLEQGIVQIEIKDYNRVIFLTPRGEDIVDEG